MVDRRRKWRAQKQDISVKNNFGGDEYIVSGASGTDYRVDLTEPSCECPDWNKREPDGGCKHILKIKLNKGIIDPPPSTYTNFGNPQNRSRSNYSSSWTDLARRTKERDNWTCQKCGVKKGRTESAQLHAHHIKAKKYGGKDDIDNLITICHSCHEEEHGHSIPRGSGTESIPDISSAASVGSSVDVTRSQAEDSSVGPSKGTNTSCSKTSKSSSTATSAPTTTTSLSNNSSSTISIFSNDENIENILPTDIDIRNEQYTEVISLEWGILLSLVVLFLGTIIGLVMSVGRIGWALVLTVGVSSFIFSWLFSKQVESTVNDIEREHEDLKKQLHHVQDRLESDKDLEQEQLENIDEILLHIDQNIDEVEGFVTDEYIEWISDTKTLFNHLI